MRWMEVYGEGRMIVIGSKYKAQYDDIDWSKPLPEPEPRKEFVSKRAPLATPMVIGDVMPLTEHIDGRKYDSKAAFRAVTKANGCIEVGNDPARLRPTPKPKPDRKAIKEAVQRAVAIHS